MLVILVTTFALVTDALAVTNLSLLTHSSPSRISVSWFPRNRPVTALITAPPTRSIGAAHAVLLLNSNIVVAWEEAPLNRSDTDIHAQMFSPSGQPLWGPSGIVVNNFRGHQRSPRVTALPDASIVVVWQSDSAGPHNNNIWCQLILPNGRLRWDTPAPVCTARGDQCAPVIATDQDTGVLIAWEDYRHGNADIYAQRIDLDGAPLGPEDGVPIEDAPGDQRNPRFVTSQTGSLLLLWDDYRPGFATPVQVQSDLTHLPIPEPDFSLALFLLFISRCRTSARVRS
ncbi:MAG: hypothetical protein N2595_03780 [bacterium]|nr:hypothetical protein [bacterium]